MAEKKKNKKKFSEHDPEKYINLEPTIREAKNSTAVISFGRMNPITSGHEKLINKVIAEALRIKATPMVFMSHSQDAKKNPLSYSDKVKFARRAFGKVIVQSKARTIIEVAKELTGKFDHLVVVVGQDRIKEFDTLLNKYNGKEFNFESIDVVSAGARDPDSEGVEGMSASKMRGFAQEGDFENFKKGLPRKLQSSAKAVYDAVRNGMNLSEEYMEEEYLEERGPLSVMQRRRRGMVMKRYKSKIAAARRRARRRKASPEKLKTRAQRKALEIIRKRLAKNKKYSEMSPTEKIALDKRLARVSKAVLNRIAKRELPKVRKAEAERLASVLKSKIKKEDLNTVFESFMIEKEDPDVGHRKGSQPKDYYKGVKKSVKDDRARHFEKHGKMDDDNPAAYKPAPGDSTAKTKTSKHTKKFKQMFGEASCADIRVRKRPHMGLNKNGSAKIDKRFKIFKKKMNEDYDDPAEDLANLILDLDSFIMSEEFDILMESDPKEALKKKAEKTGISYGILKKVFDRGVAAWRTGHRPGTTPTQWGLARVNSFSTKSKGTWGKADKDLAAKVRKEEVELSENFLGKIKGALGLGWNKIGDTVRGSVILDYLDSNDFYASQNLEKRIKSSKFKLIELDLETAKKYAGRTAKKANVSSMIDPDKEMHSRQWKLTRDSLIKSPPVLMSDGDILDGNHRIDRAIKLKLPKIPVLIQVGKGTWGKADKDLAAKVRKEEIELDSFFDLNEKFELMEASIMDKALAAIHKHVVQGTELSDIAFQVSRARGVNKSGRELQKAYIAKHGEPKKKSVSPQRTSALKKKYGFSEAKEIQFEHGSYKSLNFDICPSAKAAFDKNVEDGKYDRKLLDAAKAVDRYLGIEKDLRLKDEVTKDDLDKMTDAVEAAKEEIKEAGLKGHNYHEIHIDNVKDMMKDDVNENAATDAVKARIKAEKQRDARKHDRMLDRAKMKDLKTKLTQEGSKDPSDREWGTDGLTKTYKKDTPGEDLKEESPYAKDLPRGSRVRFSVKKITGEDYDDEGTVVGTDANTLRLRIRDNNGQLHIVKHEDADKIG